MLYYAIFNERTQEFEAILAKSLKHARRLFAAQLTASK